MINQLDSITVERLCEIESQRNQTMSDPSFQKWMKELNVSSMHKEPDGILNARHMMSLWDSDRYESKDVILAIKNKVF